MSKNETEGVLIEVPPQKPKWKTLAEKHSIFTHKSNTVENHESWSAWYFKVLEGDYCEDWKEKEPMDLIAEYCVLIEDRGGFQSGATEREAVVGLVQRLQLEGWKEVSL
jgi:hypothetical protein